MKKSFWVALCILIPALGFSQTGDVQEKVNEVMSIIDEQSPSLQEYLERLEQENAELEERIVVIKYHKGNKEVDVALNEVVSRIGEYYKAVSEKIKTYESVWFDESRNLIDIYTRYGELKEATGGGSNELKTFVDAHSNYLDLMENVKSDLIAVGGNLDFVRNSIVND